MKKRRIYKKEPEITMTVNELLDLLISRCEQMKSEPNIIERKRRFSELVVVMETLRRVFSE